MPPVDRTGLASRQVGIVAQGRAVGRSVVGLSTRLGLLGLIVLLASVSAPSPRSDIPTGLFSATRDDVFSLVGWQVATLATRAGREIIGASVGVPSDGAEQVALVESHFANVTEIRRLRQQRDALFSRGDAAKQELPAIEAALRAREAEFDRTRRPVETIVRRQISATMDELGLRAPLVALAPGDGWPVPFLRVSPPAFFTFQRLPLNIVVSPRDRIELVASLLLSPDLTTPEIDRLEAQADAIGVASLVTPIGGLGSYPSMIPDSDPLRRALAVIGHEWTHHYLIFWPLGRAFFTSYQMRSVNETVADIVGDEIGRHTYERFYQPTNPPTSAVPPPQTGPPRADFGTEMRRIRREVEHRLAAGDVAGAEQYMAEQRQALVHLGWNVRRLNTAYLAFFGAYSGGANRFESPLRRLRASSGSLSAFLEHVRGLTEPDEVASAR